MTLVTAMFLLSCLVVGVGFSGYLPVALRIEERLPIAAVVGAMAVTLAAVGAIAIMGFSGMAVIMAVMAAGMVAMPGLLSVGPSLRSEGRDFRRRLGLGWRDPASPAPLLGLCVVTWPLIVRILGLAYQPTNGGIAAGHLSTFGDWQAHLAYAGHFAYRDDLDLTTPLSAGDDLAYHFGVDLFAAIAVPTGASLHAALQLTSGYLAFALVPILYLFGRRLFERRSVAVGGTVLFLMAGGWGFTRFLDDVQAQPGDAAYLTRFRAVLWNQPRDYTRDFDTLWMDNPVLGHLYPQRPTLVGFAVVLFGLAILWSARQTRERGAFLWAGVVVGLTPLFHTFGWGTAVVLGSIWALTDRVWTREGRDWLWFLVPAFVLALPAVAWLVPPSPSGSFRWHWGWVTDGSPAGLIRFWFDNTGFFPLLFLVALLWRPAMPRRVALAIAPIWLWFIGVHLAIPHPWEGNNAKYAIFWWMLGAFAVAALFMAVLDHVPRTEPVSHWLAVGAVGVMSLSLVFAGGLDLVKAIDGTHGAFPAEVSSAGEVLVGEWVRETTPDDAVFVNSSSSTHQPVASLGGRSVVTSSDGWVFDLGLDWAGRAEASRAILAGTPEAAELIELYGVDYVVIGPRELAEGASPDYWNASATLVYDFGGYRIYEL